MACSSSNAAPEGEEAAAGEASPAAAGAAAAGVAAESGWRDSRSVSEGGEETDSEEGEETDSEEEEEEVGIALSLPKRSTRGKAYAKLVGEAQEKDSMFWGHDTWAEESEDEEYDAAAAAAAEEEEEQQEEPEVDSDFDAAEDDSSGSEQQHEEGSSSRRRKGDIVEDDDAAGGSSRRQKNKAAAFYQQALKRKLQQQKRKQQQQQQGGVGGPKGPPSPSPRRAPNTRVTTRVQTEQVELQLKASRQQQQQQAAAAAASSSSSSKEQQQPEMTQEEHLLLADKTERETLEALHALQQHRELRQLHKEWKGAAYKGPYEMLVSWASYLQVGPPEEEAADAAAAAAGGGGAGAPAEQAAATKPAAAAAGETAAAEGEEEEEDHEKVLLICTDSKLPSIYQEVPPTGDLPSATISFSLIFSLRSSVSPLLRVALLCLLLPPSLPNKTHLEAAVCRSASGVSAAAAGINKKEDWEREERSVSPSFRVVSLSPSTCCSVCLPIGGPSSLSESLLLFFVFFLSVCTLSSSACFFLSPLTFLCLSVCLWDFVWLPLLCLLLRVPQSVSFSPSPLSTPSLLLPPLLLSPPISSISSALIPAAAAAAPAAAAAVPPSPVCAVTGARGRYFDPLTRCFFSSAAAFRALREAFHRMREREVYRQLVDLDQAIRTQEGKVAYLAKAAARAPVVAGSWGPPTSERSPACFEGAPSNGGGGGGPPHLTGPRGAAAGGPNKKRRRGAKA
ncbi:hypothetical protein Efla_000753 [Eimeria flavescens]